MPAQLPAQYEERNTIERLEVGQHGYTVPWAMHVDIDMGCWLHARYTMHREPSGTVTMLVERRADGYHVDLSSVDYRWQPSRTIPYTETGPEDMIPVAAIHTRNAVARWLTRP